MTRSSHPSSQLPLSVPVFQILVSLADRDLHGYAIIQDVSTRTEGEVQLTASTLYAAIKRMLDAGMVEEVNEPRRGPDGDDARRRYRSPTPIVQSNCAFALRLSPPSARTHLTGDSRPVHLAACRPQWPTPGQRVLKRTHLRRSDEVPHILRPAPAQ